MSNKKYWKSAEELNSDSRIVQSLKRKEFVDEIPVDEFLSEKEQLEKSDTSRRDFLKYVGFSTVAASLAACEGPVTKVVPYVVQPEQIRPGVSDYYATTIADGFDFASVLVKTREGRPIRIESNKETKFRHGSANGRVQASVLSMYDNLRLKNPIKEAKEISWEQVDKEIVKAINKSKSEGKEVVVLTPTLASPSSYNIFSEFSEKIGGVKHVEYDAVSEYHATKAFQNIFGVNGLPNYDFSKAETIISFGADFLGDWHGGGFEADYAKRRVPSKKGMSRHYQLESNMSLSGANADVRLPLTSAQQRKALLSLVSHLLGKDYNAELSDGVQSKIKEVTDRMSKNPSQSVLVSGINDIAVQELVLQVNAYLRSEAFDVTNYLTIRKGNQEALSQLIKDMNFGNVGVLIISSLNPIYTLPNSKAFENGLKKVGYSLSLGSKLDETAKLVSVATPQSHSLESWGDVQFDKKTYGFIQPAINLLFNSRQLQDCLLKWSGSEELYYDYLKTYWSNRLNGVSWNKIVHDGFYLEETEELNPLTEINLSSVESKLSAVTIPDSKGMELSLYTKLGMGDGQQANNPWLQEFPDPITRVSWDNYLTISKTDADKLGLINKHVATGALNGSYANVVLENVSLKVPVIIQPGQAKGTVGLSLGYGRKEGLKKEMQIGVNAYKFYKNFNTLQSVVIEKTEGEHEFACIQLHNTLMGRGDIIKETTLDKFISEDEKHWNPKPHVSLNHQEVLASKVSIWDNFDRTTGHHFNLSIDLNACTGCGACVIACHAENNVPVVGKREVRRSRDMHWLRIDRYYSSESTFEKDVDKKESISGVSESMSQFGELEISTENPQVVFQPVMCQHCNHAPCETVCPVAATSHGRQGQNQMAYNRCVGTRYCANNCPYKVRRFNWFLYNNNDEFNFNMNDDLGKMVINPDVNVRSRGVMEKCSMCIQMTQRTILDAKRDGRIIKDGEFQTACSSACSTGAMVFGDVNDESSKVRNLLKDDRSYHLLEHVGTQPNVFYHVKVRNNS